MDSEKITTSFAYINKNKFKSFTSKGIELHVLLINAISQSLTYNEKSIGDNTSPCIREQPFNLKGGLCFFSKKNILIPNVAEKNILILVEEKKNNLIQSFCHITYC
jgi:hypothetical protein